MAKWWLVQKQVSEEEVVQPLKQVVRIATEEDEEHVKENIEKAQIAMKIGLEKLKNMDCR